MTEARLLTTPEVAERLGVTTRRVQALIKSGRLPSKQYGRDHVINEADLALVSVRKPGRPPKPKPDDVVETSGAVEAEAVAKPKAKRKKNS